MVYTIHLYYLPVYKTRCTQQMAARFNLNVLVVLGTYLAELERRAHLTVELILLLCNTDVVLFCVLRQVTYVWVQLTTVWVQVARQTTPAQQFRQARGRFEKRGSNVQRKRVMDVIVLNSNTHILCLNLNLSMIKP